MIHDEQLKGAFDRTTGVYDFSVCFNDVSKILSGAHFTVGNLETTLSGEDKIFSGYPLFNSPDELAFALKETGFDLLTRANNHCLDRGEEGLLRTSSLLDSLGIIHTGVFSDSFEKRYALVDVNGIQIAFLSYTYGTNGLSLPQNSSCIINYISTEDISNNIENARADGALFVCVIIHYGTEYAVNPSRTQKAFFDTLAFSGADAVIGMHPHVVQPMAFSNCLSGLDGRRKSFFAYSLGNFISSQRTVPRDAGVILGLDLLCYPWGKTVISKISFLPTYVRFRPSSGKYDISVLDAVKAYDLIRSGSSSDFSPYDKRRIISITEGLPEHITGMSSSYYCFFDTALGMFVFSDSL
ncbi:CapA family protein [candidate division WOR-3 bacterium]|nr:CapA family protein [candidate division WOR-3 bacterium]